VSDLDALGREPLAAPVRKAIASAFKDLPNFKRAALLVRADTDGAVVAHFAARLGDAWKVAGGIGFRTGEPRPAGYVAVEAAW
jgi:hypothetical protein